jgi:hypothetical protein
MNNTADVLKIGMASGRSSHEGQAISLQLSALYQAFHHALNEKFLGPC